MRKVLGVALIAVLVAAVAAPALASGSARPVKKVKLDVDLYSFTPGKMTIKKGTKVVWKWVDGNDVAHDVAVKKGPVKFHSAEFKFSGTYSHIFRVKGTYHLYCIVHPFMTETVIVK